MTAYFKQRTLSDIPLGDIEAKLQEAVIEDPELKDTTNLSVKIEDRGLFKDHIVHLIGKVGNEKEKQRVEEIVDTNTGRELKVSNELHVG